MAKYASQYQRNPELWERQPEESRAAFRAFKFYRDMEGRRSVARAAELAGISKDTAAHYSHVHSWQIRAEAADDQLDREVRAAKRASIIKARLKQAAVAGDFIDKIAKRIQNVDPDDIPVHNLPQFLDTAVKVQRLALGMATESIDILDGNDDPATKAAASAAFKSPEMVSIIDRLGELIQGGDVVVDEKPSDG